MGVPAKRGQSAFNSQQLAEKIDKTAETVSNIERGHVLTTLDTLRLIPYPADRNRSAAPSGGGRVSPKPLPPAA
ncbi:MAG: helix-turn-helix transcriptional regulator [Magnetospirillum sp.]|nr:helix-turn-helix transcriptional regulator [Magnetospirillum sp.]